MRLDLAERLRCPHAHAPTPLIVVASRVVERDLVDGVAGCPVCHAEVRITEGDAWFDGAATVAGTATATTAARARHDGDAAAGASTNDATADDATALERLTALLGLADPGGAVLLSGTYARLALPLAANAEYSVVTIGDALDIPEAGAGYRRGLAVAAVRGARGRVPFVDATFRAAALGAALPAALAADAVRCVQAGGRVLGALAVERPAGVEELARDATEWVGERVAVPPIVPLSRRGG